MDSISSHSLYLCSNPTLPLLHKKVLPIQASTGFPAEGEPEDWPQHHKGGMFGEKEESDQEETGGLKPISEEV